jgi:hypothetical protein
LLLLLLLLLLVVVSGAHLISQHECGVASKGVALHRLRTWVYLNTQDPAACSSSNGGSCCLSAAGPLLAFLPCTALHKVAA